MTPEAENRELNWNERIDEPNEGDMVIFPEANYPFTVLSFIRGRHPGSEKLPPCNMVTIDIEFYGGPTLGTTIVKHKMFMHSKTVGLLCQFFRGVGLRKHKEPLDLDWNRAVGLKGWAKLGKRVWDGKDLPDIKKFIYPENWPDKTPAQVAPPVQLQQPAVPGLPAQPVQPGLPTPANPFPASPAYPESQPFPTTKPFDEDKPF